MNRQAIGIIDSNIGGLTILKELQNKFPSEDFIYLEINKFNYSEELDIEKPINQLIQILISRDVKMIIIVCDILANLVSQISLETSVPIINIAKSTIKYVNVNYENKNMLFLAVEEVLDSGYYQKHLRSDQLYSIYSSSLNELVEEGHVKTAMSFNEVIDLLHPYTKKYIDILIPASSNLSLLKTEYLEVLPNLEIICLDEVLSLDIERILSKNKDHKSRKKGKIIILTTKNKRKLKMVLRDFELKCKKIDQINYEFSK